MNSEAVPPHKRGVTYPDEQRAEIIDELCERLTAGESLISICSLPHMPGMSSVFRWLNSDPASWQAYVRAREAQAHYYAQLALDEAMTATDAQIGRLRMDALKWSAGKLAPKYFGDSTQLRHADADGEKLDTKGLVSELLSLMPGNTSEPIEGKARNVTPKAAPAPVKSVYRPRIAPRPADDVDDLV